MRAHVGKPANVGPRAIPLDEWLDVCTPGMLPDGREVAVVPNTEGQAPVVSPGRMAEDLREELQQYE